MAAQQDPPKKRCTDEQKALFAAAREGDVDGCRRLLIAGDVRANDVVHALSGGTALHAGIAHRAVVKLLIEDFRADVNARRRDGSTALMDACEAGDLEIARELLDIYGADPHAEDRDGHTALDLAREHGHSKVAALVEDRGGLPGLKKSVARPAKEKSLATGVEATPLSQNARDRLYTAPRAVADPQSREVAAVARRIGGDRTPDPAAARDACDACGKTVAELKRCSRCRAAAYCSTACQRTAWPRHKDHCRRAPKAAPAPAAPAPAPAAAPAPAPATTTIKRTDFKPAKNEWALFDEHSSRGFGVKETT